MKIGISALGLDLNDSFAYNFGRCPCFIIIESSNGKIVNAYVNSAQNAPGGAGIQAAQSLLDNNVEVVIAPQMGPNAFRVLGTAGIKIFSGRAGTIKDNIQAFIKGELTEMIGSSGRGIGRGMGRGYGRGLGPGQNQGQGQGQDRRKGSQ